MSSCPSSSRSYSSSSSSSSSSIGFVRKITDSTIIGSQRREPSRKRKPHQERQERRQVRQRVVSCNFEMKVPTNALRIDMTILVSTNDVATNDDIPRPSVSYKITICTPRAQAHKERQEEVPQESTTTTTTTTTLNWSSKFTMAKDLDENIDPFHEWTGSFALGEKSKQKTLRMEDCSFYQIEGTFIGNYDDDNEGNGSSETNSASTSTSTSPLNQEEEKEDLLRSSQKMVTTAATIAPRKKQRRSSNMGSIISKEDQEQTKILHQQQQQQLQQPPICFV
jgi:hypothetical protein